MLNTAVSGEEWGHLAEKELAFLDEALARHPERSALIGLHHPPVAVGSRWIDAIGLKNGDAFFEVTDRHPQVRVILFGHIHQAFTAKRKGVVLLGTPATCIQFKPHADAFCLDTSQPGYRWLELFPDGRVTTDVVRTT